MCDLVKKGKRWWPVPPHYPARNMEEEWNGDLTFLTILLRMATGIFNNFSTDSGHREIIFATVMVYDLLLSPFSITRNTKPGEITSKTQRQYQINIVKKNALLKHTWTGRSHPNHENAHLKSPYIGVRLAIYMGKAITGTQNPDYSEMYLRSRGSAPPLWRPG